MPPIGRLPVPAAINLDGLEITADTVAELERVDLDEWRAEVESIREHFATFGADLPPELDAQLTALSERLATS